jgi:hypothetical protein
MEHYILKEEKQEPVRRKVKRGDVMKNIRYEFNVLALDDEKDGYFSGIVIDGVCGDANIKRLDRDNWYCEYFAHSNEKHVIYNSEK